MKKEKKRSQERRNCRLKVVREGSEGRKESRIIVTEKKEKSKSEKYLIGLEGRQEKTHSPLIGSHGGRSRLGGMISKRGGKTKTVNKERNGTGERKRKMVRRLEEREEAAN